MSSITIATPYAKDGLLYVSSGYVMDKQKPIYAIRPGATGDITLETDKTRNDFVAWCQRRRAVQPVDAGLRRPAVRAVRPGLLRLLRRQDGRGNL